MRLKAMELLYHRVFRSGESFQADATSIAMTWPDVKLPGGSDHHFAEYLGSAFFGYLRLREKVAGFDIDDPIPAADKEYGCTNNNGIYTIFDAARHDIAYKRSRGEKIDVVTDGNQVITRKCDPAEVKLKKRGLGRPQKNKQRFSRCKSVQEVQNLQNLFRKRTEGIYGTFHMNIDTPIVLHLAEMLNAECTEYKRVCINEVANHSKIRIFCHDCSCKLADAFQGVYCEMCFLDTWHAKKHKCDKQLFDPAHKDNAPMFKRLNLNSEVAEQSWRRFNTFAPMTRMMTRARFRCFLRHLCIWRNEYTRGAFRTDLNPTRSYKAYCRMDQLKQKRLRRYFALKAKDPARNSKTKKAAAKVRAIAKHSRR